MMTHPGRVVSHQSANSCGGLLGGLVHVRDPVQKQRTSQISNISRRKDDLMATDMGNSRKERISSGP